MLPLLLGAGRMLAAGAVRGAAAGATRGAIAQSVKKATVETAKKKAGGLAKSFIKKKITNAKKVSTGKLIPRAKKDGGGGGLVRKKSSAIVKRPTTSIQKVSVSGKEKEEEKQQKQEEKKPFNGDELIQELTAIKETLVKIKGVLGSNLANTLRDQKNQRILKSKQKASEKEGELEKKPQKKEGGKGLEVPIKKMSFLDMIWNFISNVLMGSLVNFIWNYIPQILKMFGEIAEGMTNTWQQLRIGIITLTTLFPKQIKFLAKLTSKIIGPPARLIGKLLVKAAGFAGSLFKKAGGLVLNLIKGPLLNLVRRVGGEALEQGVKGVAKGAAKLAGRAAGAAAGAVGSSAKLLNRLKIFSKVFKRVPVIGMLIGIGIDLAMGESLDRAVVGAIGASLGTAIGGAIGTGLIPIPIVGSVVGGAVGSAIGDWAAKKFYGDLTGRVAAADKAAPLERRYAAGRIGGGTRTMPTRNATVQGKPSIATSKISPEVENKAREDVLKDEKSLQRFKTLSSVFAGTPFIGQLLKLGIDIGMGGKVEKTQTDAAAQDLGFTIGRAMENDEFTVPGLNKRIIGPLSKNLTEWAKRKIFYEVKSREGLFPSIEKGKEDAGEKGTPGGGDGGGPGGGGGGGGSGSSYSVPEVRALLDAIAFAEGTTKSYGVISGGDVNKDLEAGKLTVREVIALGNTFGQPGSKHKWSGATGRYQFMPGTLNGMVSRGKLKYDDLFTPAKQDEAAWMLVQGRGVTLDQLKKEGLSQSVADKLAPEWASFPYSPKGGKSYYGQGYKSLASLKKVYDEKLKIRQEDIAKSGGGSQPEATPKQGGKKIFLHWTAGGYNDDPSKFGYNAVFDGSGNKRQIRPYNQAGEHTWHRNTNSVGLAVAAMGGKPDPWSVPPKASQIQGMTSEAAKIAKSWGWKASDINKNNVMTHAEIARVDGYGPGSGDKEMRWDFLQTAKGKPDWSGGDELRQKIKAGMGGGFGFNHHLLPKYSMGGNHPVTSEMGMRNLPISPGMHMGVDITGTTGEPLQAFTDGTVEATSPPSPSAGYGNWVSWIDDKGIGHFYGHMNKPPSVKAGQKVKKGTVLGELGSTGKSTGPHLHWEAATNPQDTGRPKNAVLSRFNPLSKYNKEAPFGGTIKPDGSAPGQAPSQPGATSSETPPSSRDGEPTLSAADLAYSIKGDDAKESYISSLKNAMGGGSGTRGKIVEYLTGDPNSPNIAGKAYDRAGHGTKDNYHDHIAFNDRQTAIDAYKFFKSKGVKVTEFKGFDLTENKGHADGSYHYSGLAFDIPGYQWGGSGPIGETDYAGSRKVRALLSEFFGGKIPTGSGPAPADIAAAGPGATPGAPEKPEQPTLSAADIAYSIKGDPAKESYIEALKQRASYDEGNQNIVMMPMPAPQANQTPNTNVSTRSTPDSFGTILNSNDIASSSVLQVMSSAFYKI